MRRRYDGTAQVLGFFLTIACLIAIVVFAAKGCQAKQACRDSGGYVERFNCRMHTDYVRQSCGNNCTIMVPHTYEVCDWRCVK